MMKKIMRSPVTTVLLFVLAAAMLIPGAIGGTRAVLNAQSQYYRAQVDTQDIGITIMEDDKAVSHRDFTKNADWDTSTGALLGDLIAENESFVIGKRYPVEYTLKNSGEIAVFSRVIVYKYWVDANGNKLRDLDPSLIEVELANTGDWITAANDPDSTTERSVYYYKSVLNPGEESSAFISAVKVSDWITTNPRIEKTGPDEEGYVTYTYYYDYNDVYFQLKIEAEGVQTHNAADAILSAWGVKATVSGNTITGVTAG